MSKRKKRNWTAAQQAVWKAILDDIKRWTIPNWIYEMQSLGLSVRREMYGDYDEEHRVVSLSKYPFALGTLVKVRPRKPFKGSIDVVLSDRMRWPPKARGKNAYAFGDNRRVPGWGYWTVVAVDPVPGVGFWHKIVRGDGEMGWVEDLQKDFVVVKPEEETK